MNNAKMIWDAAVGMMAGIGTLAAFVGAVYLLISRGSQYKAWRRKRIKRSETLDRLVDNAEILSCNVQTREDHTSQLNALGDKLDAVYNRTERTVYHNRRQDAEIERTREQGGLIIRALFALLDVAHNEGHNGPVTRAHEELREYVMDAANRPYSAQESGEKEVRK